MGNVKYNGVKEEIKENTEDKENWEYLWFGIYNKFTEPEKT
jgi:hypothetical protein